MLPKHSSAWASCWKTRLLNKQGLKVVSVLFILALNGCATPSVTDGLTAPRLPRDSVGWSLQGKAAVTQSDNGGSTVNLEWSRPNATRDHIRLSGPLGTGALEVFREDERLFWIDAGVQQPLDLLPLNGEAQAIMATLPLNLVSTWLMGYPDSPADWEVKITQWQILEGWQLPRKIEAYRGDISVRLVVLAWDFEERQ